MSEENQFKKTSETQSHENTSFLEGTLAMLPKVAEQIMLIHIGDRKQARMRMVAEYSDGAPEAGFHNVEIIFTRVGETFNPDLK